jgi:hypothetical protein
MTPSWAAPLIAVVALAIGMWELRRYRLGEASLRWRRTEGRIVDLWFDAEENSEQGMIVFGDEADHYSAHLIYEYVVAGRRYRSRHFTYRPTASADARKVYGLLRHLRAGQPVEVRYDPRRPERAVVLPGTDDGNLLRIAGWGLLALLATAIAIADPSWL